MHKVFAAGITNPVIPSTIGGGASTNGAKAISLLLTNVIDWMFIFAFVIGFLYMITGGLQWITSGGDKANLESARNKIIHAMIGIIVVASLYGVLALLGSLLGVNLQKLPLPSIDGKTSTSTNTTRESYTRVGADGETEYCSGPIGSPRDVCAK